MNKKTRTVLFLSLLILFLITAPLTVFYSLGWRFDWNTKRIIQPGIFYFKILPKNTQIYIDGKLEKKTDFFFGSALIENLLPKKYQVEIKKQDFHSWKKTLEIKKRQVTEAKNIILIPEKPQFDVLSEKIEKFYFLPDNKKIILKEKIYPPDVVPAVGGTSPAVGGTSWALKIFDIEKNLKSYLVEEKNFTMSGQGENNKADLVSLKFSPDSKKIILEIGSAETLKYYLLEIEKLPYILEPLDFPDTDIQEIYFHPKNINNFFILKNGELKEKSFNGDINQEKLLPELKNIIACSVENDGIYHLSDSGFVSRTDFSLDNTEKLNLLPLTLKKETEYKIINLPNNIILEEGNTFYLLDEEQKIFKEMGEAKILKFSPDFKKIAYSNDYDVWILFLEKIYDQPQKEKKEQLFLTRFSEKIGDVFWFTSNYLLFNIGNKIKIAEIDDRDKINIVDLAEFENPEIFFNNLDNKLYILSKENLISSEELIP